MELPRKAFQFINETQERDEYDDYYLLTEEI